MISYIHWNIKKLDLNFVIIASKDGIGYEILINERIYAQLWENQQAELFIYHHITENGQNLFGFLDFDERELFKELIKISWVGGKVAQNILSLGWERLKEAVLQEDKKLLGTIKWVGKKMTEKIILELKDKDFIKHHVVNASGTKNPPNNNIKIEVIDTLTSMGYNLTRIEEVLQTLPEEYSKIEEIIPYVIKNI